jgi:Spy/CpxP family protein refolding chaperone
MTKLTTIAAALTVAAGALAAATPADQADKPAAKGERIRQRARERFEKFCEAARLTPEQRSQVEQILKTHRQAARDYHRGEEGEQLRALRRQLREALKAGDREKVKQLREQLAEQAKGLRGLHQGLRKQLDEVLNDEQMAKARHLFVRRMARRRPGPGHPPLGGALRRLDDLTDEQRERIAKIGEQAKAEITDANSPQQKRQIHRAAMKDIVENVLTDAQRKALKRGGPPRRRPWAGLRGLDLSDEQKQRAQAIMAEARKKAAKAETPEQKRQILRDAMKAVHDDVLNDAQREKIKERLERFKRHHRRARGRGKDKDDAE